MIRAVDLFAGAGGASEALRRACAARGLALDLTAINHWPTAVASHRLNHPRARHLCARVEEVVPRHVVPGGRLDILLAGPSCVHHSRARGGRPVNDQERASPWCILRWLDELTIENLLIENVSEFQDWGPTGADGRPLRSRRGECYQDWLRCIRGKNYRVEERVLNAADFGDPTTRHRLFIVARRCGRKVAWPEPTHSRTGGRTLYAMHQRWRAARDVIDWTVPSTSIFARRKPLAPKTMARILAGLEKFGGKGLRPFLVVLRRNLAGRSVDDPLPTLTAGGTHVGLAQPFLMHVTHGDDVGRVYALGEPVPTITGANRGELGLVEPFILQQQAGGAPRSVGAPLPTIAGAGAQALVRPFLVPLFGEREGQEPRTHDLADPLPTVTASKGGPALVEPIISRYYGTGHGASPVSAPIPTLTSKDRLGLVMPVIDGQALDIHFRMLKRHELQRAMSFGDGYQFAGTLGDQVKQVGNAWPVCLGEALIGAILDVHVPRRAAAADEAARVAK